MSSILGRSALRLVAGKGETEPLLHRLRTDTIFATAKIGLDRIPDLKLLQAAGCYVVDVNLSFSASAAAIAEPGRVFRVRDARTADQSAVRAIASTAFRFSRFHLDPAFPAVLANRIKAEWACNFFAGKRGDCLLLAEDEDGSVEGFLLALMPGNAAIIDLIAVSPQAAGRGIGRALVANLASRAAAVGKMQINVGTQGANAPAARFYESLGFRLQAAQYVLHHHGISDRYCQQA